MATPQADKLVREEYPHPCPLPERGMETLTLMPVFWSPPPLRGRDRVGRYSVRTELSPLHIAIALP